MENRFTFKDIVIISLVVLVGVLVLLGMLQKQRQWGQLDRALKELDNQSKLVEEYKRGLADMDRDQKALRDGLEETTQKIGEMTDRVNELVDEVKQKKDDPAAGALLNDDAGLGLSGESWAINFRGKPIDDDATFHRVAGLENREGFARGDFFIDAFSATVKSLTPLVAGDVYSDRIEDYVLETLLELDPETLTYKPWIATGYTVSPNGLTFTFSMRDDVVFSDGSPLTAHDVQFTYEWIMNPKVSAPRSRAYYAKFEYVKALDDYTVQFKFQEPYFSALGLCADLEILSKKYYSQFTEDEYNSMPGLLFGSGPYKMRVDPVDWTPGSQKIEVVRNDNYWGPRPPLDRVIWREILEDTAMTAEFRNREIDRLSVRASSFRKMSRDDDLRRQANLYEYDYVSSGYIYIGWNQEKNGRSTKFADKRVRQAMTLLIDREQICSRVFDNLATPASGPFHPLGWQGDPSIEPWPYDPSRAAALLEEAGYIDRDGDGIRESPQGVPFTFKLIHSAGSPETKQMVLLMQDAMKKAGVKLEMDPLDWPLMQQKLDDRNFDAIMLGWGGSVESDVYQMFHSSQSNDGGDNYISHKNPELDKLIEQARSTVDRAECTRLWNRVHAQLHEDQPYTFMFNRKAVVFIDKRLKNVKITKVGMSFAWEYYVPNSVQMHMFY